MSENNLSLALKFIVEKFGEEVLLDSYKVKSLLLDLCPKLTMEINWIVDAIDIGITRSLLKNGLEDASSKQQAIEIFEENHVTPIRKDYILDNLYYAMGWSEKEVANIKDYKDTYKEKINKNKINLDKSDDHKEASVYIPEQPKIHKENVPERPSIKKTEPIQVEKTLETKEEKIKFNPNHNKKRPKKKSKKWLLLLLCIIPILFAGSIFASKLKKPPLDVYVSNYKFNQDYEYEDSVHIFELNKNITLDLDVQDKNSSKIDKEKISYSVDNPDVCGYKPDNNKCDFTGILDSNTNIRVYYDGKEIKSIAIGFRGVNVEEEEDNQDTEENAEVETTDEVESEETETDSLEGGEYKAELAVESFIYNYQDAVNFGDISYISDYLSKNGDYYKELEKSIPALYKKGTQIEVGNYTIEDIKYEDGNYRVCVSTNYYIYTETSDKYQVEYIEYIVKEESQPYGGDSEYVIDRYENWEKLDEQEL